MITDASLARILRRSVQACAAIAGALASLVLLSWVFGDAKATALGPGFVPMAPSTACSILLLSSCISVHSQWPSRKFTGVLAHLTALGLAWVGLLLWAQAFFAFELPIEGWLTIARNEGNAVSVGRMSPLTAATLVLTSLAFALELSPRNRRWLCRQAASFLALAALSVSAIVVLSYAAGAPLLYGTNTIPMAVLTAVAFVSLGLALVAGAGADTFPVSLFQSAPEITPVPLRTRTAGGLLLTFLLLSLGIGTVGYCYFRHQVTASREAAETGLSAIADLKVRQVLDWRKERLGSANRDMVEPFAAECVEKFLANPADNERRASLSAWLKLIRERNQGLRAVLLDPQMNVRLAFPENKVYFGPIAQEFAKAALHSNQVVLSDLHRSRFSGEIHLDLAIPVIAGRAPPGAVWPTVQHAGASAVGVIVVEIDPSKYLYPTIRDWPTPSPTAEALLIRREGNEIVFLNDLRHQTGTALSLRLPVESKGLVAAEAALGYEGVVVGIDYRNVPVLAATRTLPGTPWSIVTKVDQAEIDAPLRERGVTTGVLALVLVVVAALSVGLIGRRNDNQWLQRQLRDRREAEEEQTLAVQRMESLLALNRMGDQPLDAIMAKVVEDAIRVTQSEIGYLAILNDDETVLTMQYWSQSAHADCKMRDKPIVYPVEKTGLWGEAVRQRKPIITNDYAAPHPAKRGTPEGHVSLTRHMNVPVFDGERIVAIAGVGNKHTDYDDRDLRQLQLLMEGWQHIVRRKRAEEDLRQYARALESNNKALEEVNEMAESATRAKSAFLANMSHEIRTPMTAILGYTEMLLDPGASPSDRNNFVAIIRRNGEHLLQLINDILDLSKIEAGKVSLELTRCNLPALISDITSLMRPRAADRGLALEVEFHGEVPEEIVTDCLRFRQALINLVGNAIKFTEAGQAKIVVHFLPDGLDGEPAVRIEVIDTGIGIVQEVLPRLFQPFNQADASTSRQYGGTGLGLAITQRLATLLGGRVSAASTLGEGSVFTLLLPTGDLSGVRMTSAPGESACEMEGTLPVFPQELAGVSVLLAEDGSDNQKLIQMVLQKAGATVEIAENGRLAVEKALSQRFDVVLMDVQMPEMDGHEATRLLREQGFQRPILALTAHAMASDRQRSLSAGCNAHLTKPIDSALLIRSIVEHAGCNSLVSQE